MEDLLKSRRGTNGGRQNGLKEKAEMRRVVVAVDATKELKPNALHYALGNFVRPGDKLFLLGVLRQVLQTPPRGGVKLKANLAHLPTWRTEESVMMAEVVKKKAEFEQVITTPELQRLVELKQVIPVVHIAAGPDRKVVAAKEALQLRATWVILDENLKKEKTYLVEKLNCNLVLMTPRNEARVLRLEVREHQSLHENAVVAPPPPLSGSSNHARRPPVPADVTIPKDCIRRSKTEVVSLEDCSPANLVRRSSSTRSALRKSVMKIKPRPTCRYEDMIMDNI